MRIRVIGGGLAGPETALTAARLGCHVDLYEMRTMVDGKPRLTPAHQTTEFGELVCSNSLKSESPNTAPWLLKQEMRRAGSGLLRIADETAVPAGHALAVDRVEFSRRIAEAIAAEPLIRVIREEVTQLNEADPEDRDRAALTILATGPLTSDALSREIERITGSGHLAFYDSISPIVDAETIDMSRVYMAARWDKGTADYINCPMDRDEFDRFLDALLAAEAAEAKEWEKLDYFEGCLPIEVLARRGRDTLRFGAYEARRPSRSANRQDALGCGAVAQGEPARRQLQPGRLSKSPQGRGAGPRAAPDSGPRKRALPALRSDSSQHVHPGPAAARRKPAAEKSPWLFFAGQLSGVEGYTESIAVGLLAGIHAAALVRGEQRQFQHHAQALLARWCTTSRTRTPRTFSRPTSHSTCWSRLKRCSA